MTTNTAAETTALPSNWDKGFSHPIRIAACGCEVPFLRNGQWFIRVWDCVARTHHIYSYADDRLHADE